jgi:ADP-ribosyl-[dinitrogen reductase] hydrolase
MIINRNTLSACLLGGAIGDALGASLEFMDLRSIRHKYGDSGLQTYGHCYGDIGKITDDTQMTLFTLEGMIRARLRWLERGIASIPEVLYHAYLRWLYTQELYHKPDLPDYVYSGWLLDQRVLHERRAPGISCISSLRMNRIGSIENPINNSKGCGTIMRIAPVGLMMEEPFQTACEISALTHGHPTGYLSAGFLAEVIYRLRIGDDLNNAIETAIGILKGYEDHYETLWAVQKALNIADGYDASPEMVEQLGAGWIAEEALAISLYCALKADNFREGVLLAVNHSGDSDSTGAIAGNILGLIHGVDGIPVEWIDGLEVRDIINEMAEDALVVIDLMSEETVETERRRLLLERYPLN